MWAHRNRTERVRVQQLLGVIHVVELGLLRVPVAVLDVPAEAELVEPRQPRNLVRRPVPLLPPRASFRPLVSPEILGTS